MAEELRKDRSLPKYAQAITLYHLIVEGSLAQPGQHFIEDFFAAEDTMPGFSAGMANVSRDEQRHIGFGVKVLSELLAESEECKAAVVELLREVLPYGAGRLHARRTWDREYTECYGFIARGHLRLRPQADPPALAHDRLSRPRRCRPASSPSTPRCPRRRSPKRQVKLLMAGIVGPPDGRQARVLAGAAAPLLRRDRPRRRPQAPPTARRWSTSGGSATPTPGT